MNVSTLSEPGATRVELEASIDGKTARQIREELSAALPQVQKRKVMVNTPMPTPEDIYDSCCGPLIPDPNHVIVGGRSVIVVNAGQRAAQ